MTQTEHLGGQNTIWLTQEAFDKLQAELDHLKGPRRQEIVAEISAARDEGDLKENGGYHAAREEQGKNEARIAQLEDMIRRAEIGETPADDGVVEPGMLVTYKFDGDDDDEAETFLLLGSREAAPSDDVDVYTPEAPLGAAINGRSKGESVTYEVNGRPQTVIILDAKPFTS
ncbi:transcription elongation factor GreA [Nocardioides sp. YIM 152588]|uniref:transcription elongation factor GreA n=1 Tax=Nocardioides sp. YIM 152588 TaxID=3158259 RepID=UPI0032E4FCDE